MSNFFNYIFHILFTNPAPFAFIIIIILVIPILYKVLYTYLNIPRSLSSFVFFSANVIILCLYIYGIIIPYYGILSPIYIEDLSVYAQYRYLILVIICIIVLILYIILYFNKTFHNYIVKFKFPYLKEELRIILHACNDKFFTKKFSFILDNLFFSRTFRLIFFILNFVIFYLYRLIVAFSFVFVCFFKGDFRLFMYIIPLMFIMWCLDVINYYFLWYLDDNFNFIRNVLNVSLQGDVIENNVLYTVINENILSFTLTDYGIKQGYTEKSLPVLEHYWLRLGSLKNYFTCYNFMTLHLCYILYLSYICCWLYISHFYFFSEYFTLTQPFWGFILMRNFSFTRNLRAPYQGHYIPTENLINKIRLATNGEYNPGHHLIGEFDLDGKFHAIGYATTGNAQGKAFYLSPTQLNGITVINQPQKWVPFSKIYIIEPSLLGALIPGSDLRLKDLDIIARLKKPYMVSSDPTSADSSCF